MGITLEKLSESQLREMFNSFPDEVQRVMHGHCCDDYNVLSGALSIALYEDYENARDDVIKQCGNDEELKGRVMNYLMGVFH